MINTVKTSSHTELCIGDKNKHWMSLNLLISEMKKPILKKTLTFFAKGF